MNKKYYYISTRTKNPIRIVETWMTNKSENDLKKYIKY